MTSAAAVPPPETLHALLPGRLRLAVAARVVVVTAYRVALVKQRPKAA